jgi:hypothetical protein
MTYDEKSRVRCPNCGGHFEYMAGFGAFSLPGEGQRMGARTTFDGSYPEEPPTSLDSESYRREQGGSGTCCAVCVCFLLLLSFMFSFYLFFGSIFG